MESLQDKDRLPMADGKCAGWRWHLEKRRVRVVSGVMALRRIAVLKYKGQPDNSIIYPEVKRLIVLRACLCRSRPSSCGQRSTPGSVSHSLLDVQLIDPQTQLFIVTLGSSIAGWRSSLMALGRITYPRTDRPQRSSWDTLSQSQATPIVPTPPPLAR